MTGLVYLCPAVPVALNSLWGLEFYRDKGVSCPVPLSYSRTSGTERDRERDGRKPLPQKNINPNKTAGQEFTN